VNNNGARDGEQISGDREFREGRKGLWDCWGPEVTS
jgi:hypothetical protein